MNCWAGKVALVTGGSTGIGKAIAVRLAAEGMVVAAAARRCELLQELVTESNGRIHPMKCDVTQEGDIVRLFQRVREEVGPIAVLVNISGVTYYTEVADCEIQKWRTMFEQNVFAVGIASREFLNAAKKSNIERGYIINVGSISCHGLPEGIGKHVYCGSKQAMSVITEGLRQELAEAKSHIKVSTLCTGVVSTDIVVAEGIELPIGAIKPALESEDIAEAAVRLLITPPNVHIADIIVRPFGERLLA